MAKKVPEEIANQIWLLTERLEIANEIIKAVEGYYDVSDNELTEGELCLKTRAKEFNRGNG